MIIDFLKELMGNSHLGMLPLLQAVMYIDIRLYI